MQITIYPYQGIELLGKGRILFGMERKQIRSFFSELPKAVMLGENDDVPTDCYDQASIRFFYKTPNLLQAIAIEYEHDVIFQQQHLLRNSYQQIKSWFQQIDSTLVINENSGLISTHYGINLWASGADENSNATAESALVYERGYSQ
jgi:hypothetical protein